jgi:hypothetical protein
MVSFRVNAFSIEQSALIEKQNEILHKKIKINFTSLLPDLLRYFVDAIYDALTVSTTAFIKFLAAVINEVALSS